MIFGFGLIIYFFLILLKNLKILLPTGRTPWGYDWHGPSLLNIQYAIKALTNPIGIFKDYLKDFISDSNKLFISGNCNDKIL